MKAQAIKRELIEWLTGLNDEKMLETLRLVKKSSESRDWWHDLSTGQKLSIERGEKDHKKGKVLTSKQLWKKYGKYEVLWSIEAAENLSAVIVCQGLPKGDLALLKNVCL